MTERVSAYDLEHNPTKAWNTFATEVDHLYIDLEIMLYNQDRVGVIPHDIIRRLQSLQRRIETALPEDED